MRTSNPKMHVSMSFAFLFIIPYVIGDLIPCTNEEAGWWFYDSHCYSYITISQEYLWQEAENYCVTKLNSHLVSILSQGENNFIARMYDARNPEKFLPWIGLKSTPSGEFSLWSDGSWLYFKTWFIHPIKRGTYEEWCGFTYPGGKWDFAKCANSVRSAFICKKKATIETELTTREEDYTTREEDYTTREEDYTTSEQPLTTSEEHYTMSEQPLTTSEQTLNTREQPINTREEPLTIREQTLTTREQPLITMKQPLATMEQPLTTKKQPLTTTEAPPSPHYECSKESDCSGANVDCDQSTQKCICKKGFVADGTSCGKALNCIANKPASKKHVVLSLYLKYDEE